MIDTCKSRILTINKVTEADSGNYICVTSNNFGASAVGAQVTITQNAPVEKRLPKFIRRLRKRLILN